MYGQGSHWSDHKPLCTPFTEQNSITINPHYEDTGHFWPTSDLARAYSGYPTPPPPDRILASMVKPQLAGGETRKLIVKIQVPIYIKRTAEIGDILVHDKKHSIVCRLRHRDDPETYQRLCDVVHEKGFNKAKAYFAAKLISRDALMVKVSDVMAEQGW